MNEYFGSGAISGRQAQASGDAAQAPQKCDKPKAKGGKIDPEDFARLQAAVAMILEQLGMVTPQDIAVSMSPQQQQAQQPQQADAPGTMGALPGRGAAPPEGAAPVMGPLDPGGAEAMATKGIRGLRKTAEIEALMKEADAAWKAFAERAGVGVKRTAFQDFMAWCHPEIAPRRM